MATDAIPQAKLSQLDATALIEQYDLANAKRGKRHNQNGPTRLQVRQEKIVDLLLALADVGDPVACAWFERT
jgi:hypothetical protein